MLVESSMRENEIAEAVKREIMTRYEKDIKGNSLEIKRERDCIVLIDVQRKVVAKIPIEK